jgi:hypothetical protein
MKNAVLFFAVLVARIPCVARIITVDDDGPADFNNIQTATDDANNVDTTIFADIVYTGTGNRDIDFKGKAVTVRSENDPADCNLLDADNWTSSNRLGRNNRWLDGQFRMKLPLSIFIRKESNIWIRYDLFWSCSYFH